MDASPLSARSLADFGWNPFFDAHLHGLAADRIVARVGAVHRGAFILFSVEGACDARLSGRLRHDALSALDLPATGDWVIASREAGDGPAVVERVLPRISQLVRQAAGKETAPQVIAANVDLVVLVTSLDHDFNARRLERMGSLAEEAGAVPIAFLNKADLCADPQPAVNAACAALPGSRVILASALDGRGLDELRACIRPGLTAVLIGMSGVGKSTTLNALLGAEIQATASVREHDSRGRHVTTHRELFLLPGGGLLLDTPGMRELGIWASDDGAPAGFDDVEALAESCRFRDCKHGTEPGCAVSQAVNDGTLEAARVASWRKLQRERQWQAARQDVHLRQQLHARWKSVTKSVRAAEKSARKRGR